MRLNWKRVFVGTVVASFACLLGVQVASGQAGPGDRPLVAEDVFTNVQVLRGISVNEFMATMGIFSASLGMSCQDCHSADDRSWENFAADNPRKRIARGMIRMMAAINEEQFGGRQLVTCFSCHRGSDRPKSTPDLTQFYGPPPPDPNDVIQQGPLSPAPDVVLDKYLQALGGAQRLAALTSWVATGVSVGYGPESEERPVEIFARHPGRLSTIIHTASGDNTTTYDGQNGWIAAPFRPVPVLALSGQDLEGLKLDVELAFPGGIKQALGNWRVGVGTVINDRDVQVVQGTSPGGALVTLYFDDESGLLVQQLRYVDSPVGRMPTQVDYADYREVAGVKIPFRRTVTWLNGRENFELREVRANVPVAAAAFSRPAPPTQ